VIETDAWGSELASWTPITVLLIGFALIVVALLVFGRGGILERIPDALERLTGIPGWAAASAGTALYGLLIAGEGFYSDVAWHIALGRDEALFTAPHTSIAVGLAFILLACAVGIVSATGQQVDTPLRLGALRVPWSMIPVGLLGAGALAGFPIDELWHQEYGVDVTMWSPPHMLMILGASLTGLAAWLILADARVSPQDSAWARGAHVVAGALTLMGLTSSQGEFDFGVPQFQQMFHPVLVTGAAGFALVAIRIIHGRGWSLGIVVGLAVLESVPIFGDGGPVSTRDGGLYIVSALVVEVAAWLLGTDRRLRFALVSGAGVATIGLAAEWWWNQGAHQPWRATLLPDALWLSLLVGLGAAVLGAAFARGIAREPRDRLPGRPWTVAAGVAVVAAILMPMPRGVADVTADIRVEPTGAGTATVHVALDPVDAADDARWFQTVSWQGGGLILAEMNRTGPGRYVTDRPVQIEGRAKTLVRLHRGGELMAAPVFLPADPEIGEEEIPAIDRVVPFSSEREFLLRETTGEGGWFSVAVHLLLVIALAAWTASFVAVGRRIADRDQAPERQPVTTSV
jgi:hypothetical protein